MIVILAILIGVLFAAAVYMILRRCIIKLLIGLGFLTHVCNLLLFSSTGMIRGRSPIIDKGSNHIEGLVADPLPQALVLTAIVISFGVTAFFIVLIQQVHKKIKVDDVDLLQSTDLMK